MKTTNNNPTSTTTTTTPVFQLSKIHRLIRPLKSSISSLETQLNQQQKQQQNKNKNKKKKNSFYSESKSNKRSLEGDLEFNHPRSNYHHHQKKYKRSNNNQQQQHQRKTTSKRKTNPISSPIFNSTPAITTTSRTSAQFNSQDNQLIELETQIKIDKLILAYKNILDAVYPTTATGQTMYSPLS
jgi:isochorismate synthase EntC